MKVDGILPFALPMVPFRARELERQGFDGGLSAASDIVLGLKSLVVASANTGGLSREEQAANQLEPRSAPATWAEYLRLRGTLHEQRGRASEAYHDYYRWPLRDRKIFEQWRESTHWGQLFDHYQSHGTLAAPADAARTA